MRKGKPNEPKPMFHASVHQHGTNQRVRFRGTSQARTPLQAPCSHLQFGKAHAIVFSHPALLVSYLRVTHFGTDVFCSSHKESIGIVNGTRKGSRLWSCLTRWETSHFCKTNHTRLSMHRSRRGSLVHLWLGRKSRPNLYNARSASGCVARMCFPQAQKQTNTRCLVRKFKRSESRPLGLVGMLLTVCKIFGN